MVFSSLVFLFTFLPLVLIFYFLVPRAAKNPVLLAASLIFYAWGEPVYLFLMLLSIGFNYICGMEIELKLKRNQGAKKALIFAVAVNIGLLGFFKYSGFLMGNLNALLSVDIPWPDLALPVGISFYTFQILSYLIDVYRRKVHAQKNLISFGLYVTMFPQLIAGPIVQYADIDRQLKSRTVTWEKFGSGTVYFIRGLGKKVLLANMIGGLFDVVSAMPQGEMSALSAWLGCLAYTFQIYFDFSGYSDMAIGLGRMFGFEFMKNFDYPYISGSVTEFWRRWHISLSSWFRDYVYIPLGGNRTTKPKHIRNIMAVWLLTGLWHGASWNFVAWGVYYGLILMTEKYLLADVMERIPVLVRRVCTMLLVMIGWVLFFSPTLSGALTYLGNMVGIGVPAADAEGIYLLMSNLAMLLILAAGSGPWVHKIFQKIGGDRQAIRIAVQCVTYTAMLLLCVACLVTDTYNPFLYFRF